MSSYKEALKQMLEGDMKSKKRNKLRSSHMVSFKTPPLVGRKKPLKRKHLTPFRASASHNIGFNVSEDETIIESDVNVINHGNLNDSADTKHKVQLVRKLDFDVENNCSYVGNMKNSNLNEWDFVEETDYTISPSTSEFSTNHSKHLLKARQKDDDDNINKLTSVSADYCNVSSPNFPHIFDYTSSDSSSSDIESSMNFLLNNTNSSISENEVAENINKNSSSSDIESSMNFLLNNTNSSISENEVAENINKDNVSTLVNETVTHETLNPNDGIYNNIIWKVTGGCVVILNKNSPLYFHGTFVLSVLYGSVDLLGHTLTPSSNEFEVYSLHGSSYLYIENKFNELDQGSGNIKNALSYLKIESHLIEQIIENWSPPTAVIFCKVLVSQHLQFLEKHTAQQLLPKLTNQELLCRFRIDSADWNVLRINSYWEDLANQIHEKSQVMLCGGKGVGKSTLLRFLINRLLMKHSKVLIIDLDPGQPEFTVSGCISLSIISEPIFGPNYTHLRTPEKCIFLRNINITYDPNEYLSCVGELMKTRTDLPPNIPTIVNYMGYSRGLGLNVIASVIPLVSPTLVVQIQSTKKQRNFPQNLSVDVIKMHSKLLDLNTVHEGSISYDLIQLESMTDYYEGWQMEPRIVRELGVLSYFSKMLGPNNTSLTNHKVPMYKVNLSNICIKSGESTNALASVNANMVALCSVSSAVNVFSCYGWGIVRGIDTENNELYLLTPLDPVKLENVTHLLLGSVNLPPAIYMAQDDKIGIVPYVSVGLITDFNSIPKRSHLHKRTYANNSPSC